ncbi:phosphoribosyltransferase [Dyadobacter sp. NIV53]|uniref:phosphoribosyltransferase n=1 Tax=Dyadobacter sp. NIV53 TaxID=2861765 RepID=UPI001C878134|nr:phosphoribosyltransferase family protein [Dyadobacter sp. NIV53]
MHKSKPFIDRRDAGFELGKLLEKKYKGKNALVLGIPRGGVEVAYDISKILDAELSVVISKKLPHPDQQEFAVGAVSEDGSLFINSAGRKLSEHTLQRIIDEQFKEIKSRIQRFRNGQQLPSMLNRCVIIVDDGIATGSTIVPVLMLCKNRNAAKVIVAAPVSGLTYVTEITSLAHEVIIAEKPEDFYAVGQVYRDFHELSDEEVLLLLSDEYIKS